MKLTAKRACLESKVATLRAVIPSFGGTLEVDEEAGVIRNAAVMTVGEASGHGFEIDHTTLQQVADLVNAAGPEGVKVRFKHPQDADGNPIDDTGTLIGRVRNAKLDGDVVRGDIHLGRFAKTLPGFGDVWSYVLAVAKDDPAGSGLSAVIEYESEPVLVDGSVERLVARVSAVEAVDFVGRPAANPHGLLSEKKPPTPKGEDQMEYDEKMKPHLKSKFGMAEDDDAKEFFSKLEDKEKDELAALLEADGDDEENLEEEEEEASASKKAANSRRSTATGLARKPGSDVVALEAKRVGGIKALAKLYGLDDSFVQLQIASEASVNDARKAALTEIANRAKPGAVSVGTDRNVASLSEGIRDGLLIRAGRPVAKPHDRARQFAGLSLVETARSYLSAVGIDHSNMGRTDVCKLVFDRGRMAALGRAQLAHTPGDFSNILRDAINKTLRDVYEETPTTWNLWARRATTPDFKTIYRTQLSGMGRLRRIKPGGEYPDKALSDAQESYTVNKFGAIITITWETMVNDDLDALNRIPTIQGAAARRTEDDVAYYALLKNATMADSVQLFHANHSNLASGTGKVGAPSITTLGNARAAMRLQTGLSGEVLNLTPTYLIIPSAIETITEQVLNSTYDPASDNSITYNAFRAGGRVPLTLIPEPRLDNGVSIETENGSLDKVDGSSTAWYVAASNSQIDTIEVAFLADEPAPVTDEEDGFRVDGRQYKIRHVVGAAAIDHRGLYKNPGA